jgi:hypothetical protein
MTESNQGRELESVNELPFDFDFSDVTIEELEHRLELTLGTAGGPVKTPLCPKLLSCTTFHSCGTVASCGRFILHKAHNSLGTY